MDQYQYSGVPMVWSDRVIGVYTRRDPRRDPAFELARPSHFVKSDSGLIALIRQMRDTQRVVVCVGSSECPAGWVTYADFSKRPFRVLLFTIMAEVEYLVAQALDLAHPDGSWVNLLKSDDSLRDDRGTLLKRQNDAIHWDVTMPLTTFAEIGHMTRALKASPKALDLLGESADVAKRLMSIPDLRNRVAHVVKPIVAGPSQIGGVGNQIDLMLQWIQSWSASLAVAVTQEVESD